MSMEEELLFDLHLRNRSYGQMIENEVFESIAPYVLILGILLFLIYLFALILNVLSILSILSAKAFTSINLLILNLAFGDMIYTLGVPMFAAQMFSKSWMFGSLGCKLFIFTEFFGIIVGVLTIMALSIERFLEIADERKRLNKIKRMTKMLFTFAYILFTWSMAFMFSFPMIASMQLVNHDGIFSCDTTWSDSHLKIFFIAKLIIIFFIPYAFIMFSSVKLLIFLNRWRTMEKYRYAEQAKKTSQSSSMTVTFTCGGGDGGGGEHLRKSVERLRFVIPRVPKFKLHFSRTGDNKQVKDSKPDCDNTHRKKPMRQSSLPSFVKSALPSTELQISKPIDDGECTKTSSNHLTVLSIEKKSSLGNRSDRRLLRSDPVINEIHSSAQYNNEKTVNSQQQGEQLKTQIIVCPFTKCFESYLDVSGCIQWIQYQVSRRKEPENIAVTHDNNDRKATRQTTDRYKHMSRVRVKASRLVLSIVLLFLIQWSPFWVFHVISLFSVEEMSNIQLINLVIGTLTYSNTIANPIIYMLATYNFKRYCQKGFCRSSIRRSSSSRDVLPPLLFARNDRAPIEIHSV